jgi:hypothetical protein
MNKRIGFCVFFSLGIAALGADKVAVRAPTDQLWVEPTDIATRDLLYGSGGKKHAPNPNGVYTFDKEDMDGTNPKFDVTDQDGTKWKVKLGTEAKPEVAATRLVWAAGYTTNEDYFLQKIVVTGLPKHLKRGQSFKQPDGSFLNVRLKRHEKHEDKAGQWKWNDNPFNNTRELFGLRVMMALVNNWDLKNDNNAVYDTGDGKIFMVKDLGASFGTTHESWTLARSKGNLIQYERSKFITHTTPGYVSFGTPGAPVITFMIYNPSVYFSRLHMESLGRWIPKEGVKWLGDELSKLSPDQVRDAFRAAGYTPEQVDAFAAVVQRRIAALKDL